MEEPAVIPPAPSQPSKLPAWVIILVVALVLCCCLLGAIGLLLAFGEKLLYELGLYTLLPILAALL
ncbi:MAG: hypothetical protein AB1531_01800 [Chloroflexota bacterium]